MSFSSMIHPLVALLAAGVLLAYLFVALPSYRKFSRQEEIRSRPRKLEEKMDRLEGHVSNMKRSLDRDRQATLSEEDRAELKVRIEDCERELGGLARERGDALMEYHRLKDRKLTGRG